MEEQGFDLERVAERLAEIMTPQSRVFRCHDCERRLPTSEASHDFVEDEEFLGLICQDCMADRERLMTAWPSREVA